MKTFSVDHIGINTSDLTVSERFYKDVMGFEFVGEIDLGGDYVAYFNAGDVRLELFRTDGSCRVNTPPDEQMGLKHIAFSVDDIDEWAEILKRKGYKLTYGPETIAAISKRVLLFKAPDNVIIELTMNLK